MDGVAFVLDDARLGFHGDDLDGADGLEVAQAAVGDGADASRATAEEAADGGFGDGGGIAAELPAELAGGGFEGAELDAGLADGDSHRIGWDDGLDAVHALEVEDDAALRGTAWP